jgi:hypothetical protein
MAATDETISARGQGDLAKPSKPSKKDSSMPLSVLAERFSEAVHILAGDGAMKQRLARAFGDYLDGIADADVPPSLRREFGDLRYALNRVAPAGRATRVRASVQKMSPAEAARHATTILRLYISLVGQGADRVEPLKVVGASHQQPPRYLNGRG